MPKEHLPGPRVQLKDGGLRTFADTDPAALTRGPAGKVNLSAIARKLYADPSTINKLSKGRQPLTLEIVAALLLGGGCWCCLGKVCELVDADGNLVPLRGCACDRELVAS